MRSEEISPGLKITLNLGMRVLTSLMAQWHPVMIVLINVVPQRALDKKIQALSSSGFNQTTVIDKSPLPHMPMNW